MTRAVFVKHMGSLRPADWQGEEMLQKIGQGQQVMVTVRRARNVQHHRLFFALLKLVCDNLDAHVTPEQLLAVIKLRIGHVDVIRTSKGVVEIPKSISFASLDQAAFSDFYDRAVAFILAEVVPGWNRDDLEAEILEMVR